MKMIKQFFSDESGATMVEYAIMVALIAIVSIIIITAVGLEVQDAFYRVCIALGGDASACAKT